MGSFVVEKILGHAVDKDVRSPPRRLYAPTNPAFSREQSRSR